MKEIPGKKSIKIINKIKKNVSKSQYIGLYGICIDHGNKSIIYDEDGNSFIDLFAGASSNSLGYNNIDIINKINNQYKKIQHSCFCYSPLEEYCELSNKLKKTWKEKKLKIIYGLTGSDANDAAIKCSLKYTKKEKILSFQNGWHGVTGLSHQANGFNDIKNGIFFRNENFKHFLFPKDKITFEKTYKEIEKELKKGNVAAMIFECIQGDGGNLTPYKNSLKKIETLLKKYETLLIIDETQSGNGRTGKYWSFQNFNLKPDLITSAKGITSGYYPLSICMGNEKIIDSLNKAQHVFTYTANPIACIAAIETIKKINKASFLEKISENGKYFIEELNRIKTKYPIIKEVRGIGLQIGLEITGKYNAGMLGFLCAQNGLYSGYFGVNNEVLRIHPPLIINKSQIKKSIKIIEKSLKIIQEDKIDKKIISNYKKYCIGLGNDKLFK